MQVIAEFGSLTGKFFLSFHYVTLILKTKISKNPILVQHTCLNLFYNLNILGNCNIVRRKLSEYSVNRASIL